MVRGPKGSTSKPLRSSSVGDAREEDHLVRKQFDQHGHQQALMLHALDFALAQNFFKQHAFVGDVLIDDPEALVVHRKNKRLAQLAQRLERCQRIEAGSRAASA